MAKSQSAVNSDIELVKKRSKKVKDLPTLFTACIYGRNKVGKTTLACSSGLDTFLIDCNEMGYESIKTMETADQVTHYPVNTFLDIDPAYWYLRSADHNHKVVVIDTITMLQALCLKWVLKEEIDREIDREPPTPDRRHYLKSGESMKEQIIRFRNLAKVRGMHVIFIAQEKRTTSEDEDEGGTVVEIHPELSPAPRSVLMSAVGTTARLYVKEVEKDEKTIIQRRLLLKEHPKYAAGTRFGKQLRRVEVEPNLEDILARISGGNNASS